MKKRIFGTRDTSPIDPENHLVADEIARFGPILPDAMSPEEARPHPGVDADG
jgi:hypothetical protein